MKWIKDIEDFRNHLFSKKDRKAEARTKSSNLLKPRDVYLSCCSLIAEQLADSGFVYLKSSQKLRLESEDKNYRLEIKFSSDRDNVAGEYIEFSGVFSISSRHLQKFSKANPLINYWSDIIFANDLGLLIDLEKGKVRWNIAINEDFISAVNILVEVCKVRLIRLFHQLQDAEYVIDLISKGTFVLTNPINTIQYLLCNSKVDLANKYLADLVKRPPGKIMQDYIKAKSELESGDLPKIYAMGCGFGYDIALIEKVYGLNMNLSDYDK